MDNRSKILYRIQAYDFAIVDMNLYLDTHPNDQQALELFNLYNEKRCQLITEYELMFGPYINTVEDVQGETFTWINNPWPWDFCKEG